MRGYANATPTVPSEARDRLIAEHADTARRIALRLGRRLPPWIDEDDLIATAMLGLAEAADRYDPSREEPFLAFAERRIRGEILDELRRGDILPRRVRTKAREIAEVVRGLEQKLGRPAEDEEIAEALGVSLEAYQKELEVLVHVSVVELTSEGEASLVGPGASMALDEEVERRRLIELFLGAVERLPERDALILALYYNEDLTYAEIGEVLSVSESRVCQLHSRALMRLRSSIPRERGPA
ncbi:MAG: RNA polymerase sigma factor FliA [Deltaproteobacteria bacterium]|nr:RNA polymerase sigma factor FliA [Deltaproteobacteria bacterium]